MNVYHEETMELLPDPDLDLGRTYPGSRFVAHHEAVEEARHLEVMRGSETMNGGKGLRGPVIDVPASPAWDEYEDCLLYHPYTEEELAAMHPPDPGPTPDTAATWDELAAAYTEGGGKCMMDSKTLVLEVLRSLGQREASELRQTAGSMTGTEIIAAERAVPAWSPQQNYTDWPVGAPVVWARPHSAWEVAIPAPDTDTKEDAHETF